MTDEQSAKVETWIAEGNRLAAGARRNAMFWLGEWWAERPWHNAEDAERYRWLRKHREVFDEVWLRSNKLTYEGNPSAFDGVVDVERFK